MWPHASKTERSKAGRGNRTLVFSLEGYCSTIELHPRRRRRRAAARRNTGIGRPWRRWDETGECRIRTCEGISHQIYSLTPLTARETPLWCALDSSSRLCVACVCVFRACEAPAGSHAGLSFARSRRPAAGGGSVRRQACRQRRTDAPTGRAANAVKLS